MNDAIAKAALFQAAFGLVLIISVVSTLDADEILKRPIVQSAPEMPPLPDDGVEHAVHSFSGPFHEPDMASVGRRVPFWKQFGDAVVEPGYVRLVSVDKEDSEGGLWNTEPNFDAVNWEARIEFRLFGGRFKGGEGFAFWYVEEPHLEGSMFGSTMQFKGLSIVFDTWDDDQQGENPTISAMYNPDGMKVYDKSLDGRYSRLEGAFCNLKIRNTPGTVSAKIFYINQTLEVFVDTHMSGTYQPCLFVPHLELKKGGYIGVSASTGQGEARDNVDIYSVVLLGLDSKDVHDAEVARATELVDSDRPFLKKPMHSIYRYLKMPKHDRDHLHLLRSFAFKDPQNFLEQHRQANNKPAVATRYSADTTRYSSDDSAQLIHDELLQLTRQFAILGNRVDQFSDLSAQQAVSAVPAMPISAEMEEQLDQSLSALVHDVRLSFQKAMSSQSTDVLELAQDLTLVKQELKAHHSQSQREGLDLHKRFEMVSRAVQHLRGGLHEHLGSRDGHLSDMKGGVGDALGNANDMGDHSPLWTYVLFAQGMAFAVFVFRCVKKAQAPDGKLHHVL